MQWLLPGLRAKLLEKRGTGSQAGKLTVLWVTFPNLTPSHSLCIVFRVPGQFFALSVLYFGPKFIVVQYERQGVFYVTVLASEFLLWVL